MPRTHAGARGAPCAALSLASTIAQMVMKMQQDLAGFAIRGDAALEMVFPPKEERPDWATFDEDQPEAEKPSANGERQTEGRFALYSVTDVTESAKPATARKNAKKEPSGPAVAVPPIAREIDYDALTLAQLRARIQSLTVTDLRALLTYEESAKARAPFQTLLANRITRATAK